MKTNMPGKTIVNLGEGGGGVTYHSFISHRLENRMRSISTIYDCHAGGTLYVLYCFKKYSLNQEVVIGYWKLYISAGTQLFDGRDYTKESGRIVSSLWFHLC